MRIKNIVLKLWLHSSILLGRYRKYVNAFREKYPNNAFVQDLCRMGDSFSASKIGYVLKIYEQQLETIDIALYNILSSEDQKTFILFVMKRWGRINILSKSEESELTQNFYNIINNYYNQRKNISDPISVKINNKKMLFCTNTPLYTKKLTGFDLLLYSYEIMHAFVLNEYYKEGFTPNDGEIIFDCGAANGDTMLAFSAYYPNSPIYSIECLDDRYQNLLKNIKLNKLKNVHPIFTFLHSSSGELEIDNEKLSTMSIDDLVKQKNITNIGLIKFDIEGAEVEALNGAINTIKTFKPILYIPIYHLESDIYLIPQFLQSLQMQMKFSLKWVERKVAGVDCVLFVKFIK